jgi:hypothetical protein
VVVRGDHRRRGGLWGVWDPGCGSTSQHRRELHRTVFRQIDVTDTQTCHDPWSPPNPAGRGIRTYRSQTLHEVLVSATYLVIPGDPGG